MQVAIKAGDPVQLDEGLKNLKSCFKFMGILTIVLLSLYGIAFLVRGIATAFQLIRQPILKIKKLIGFILNRYLFNQSQEK